MRNVDTPIPSALKEEIVRSLLKQQCELNRGQIEKYVERIWRAKLQHISAVLDVFIPTKLGRRLSRTMGSYLADEVRKLEVRAEYYRRRAEEADNIMRAFTVELEDAAKEMESVCRDNAASRQSSWQDAAERIQQRPWAVWRKIEALTEGSSQPIPYAATCRFIFNQLQEHDLILYEHRTEERAIFERYDNGECPFCGRRVPLCTAWINQAPDIGPEPSVWLSRRKAARLTIALANVFDIRVPHEIHRAAKATARTPAG